jgi:hypothetical protein
MIDICDVCSYLADVAGVELSHFYLDYDIASEIEVGEKRVNELVGVWLLSTRHVAR